MDNKDKIRIQFDDFKLHHFDITPIWEFAIDEEGDEDQDETTLKPRFDLSIVDPADGLFIVQCEFKTPSGKIFHGLCHPTLENSIRSIQPYILTNNGIVMFWCGIVKPTTERKQKYYDALNETADNLFPLKFKSNTPTKGAKLEGVIDGFMWFTFADRNKIFTER